MCKNSIVENIGKLWMKVLMVTALAALMLLAGLGLSKASAGQLSISVASSDGYPCDKIYDDSYFSTDYYDPGTEITITAQENMDSLYIQWETIPGEWTLKVNGKDYKFGKEGYLHEYVKLPEAATSAVIVVGDTRLTIADVYAFSAGSLPSFVQTWDAPYEEADVLLISTHADDEVLFFGGIIPNYIARGNVRVQVAYFTNLFLTEPVRNHEILNGLWTMGVTHYPQLGEFYDVYSESYEEAAGQYDYDASLEYIVRTIRRFHPQVVIGQDPNNGEYGHGGHMWCARTIQDALEITADSSKYPESANKYGTWDVAKTYFHMYPEGPIVMDVRTPLAAFGGKSALEVARAAYLEHQSQQWCWFYVTDDGYDAYGEYDDKGYNTRCTIYGLYRTTVGPDFSGCDILDNITPYDDQAKQSAAADPAEDTESEDETQAADVSENAETAGSAQSVVDHNSVSSVPGGKHTTAITILVILAVILFIAIVGIYVVANSRAKVKKREQELKRKRAKIRNAAQAGKKPQSSAGRSAQPQTGRAANRSQGMRSSAAQRSQSQTGSRPVRSQAQPGNRPVKSNVQTVNRNRTSGGMNTSDTARTNQRITDRGQK